VARAKRTARADARRRYRAATEIDLPDEQERDPVAARPEAGSAVATGGSSGRLGFGAAFRGAFHPVNLRSDIGWLPSLVRSKALWIPLALTAAATLAYAVAPTAITYLLVQYMIWAPPIGTLLIAGFLAPRASWLFGLVLGLVTSVEFAGLLYSGLWNSSATAIGAPTVAPDLYGSAVVQWIVLSLIAAPFFASAMAWYRRFLRFSNPNRGRGPAAPRRGDGRSRGPNGSQKAGARR
jgi:hypothetical protein